MTAFGDVLTNTPLRGYLIIPIAGIQKGGTAPTDATVGTSPEVAVLLFDAVAELANLYVQMPLDWDKAQDACLVLLVQLSTGETNADTLDITLDYTVPIKESTGSGVTKTSSQVTGSVAVTTANGLAAGDMYTVVINLDKDDANNPFTAADANGFAFEFHLTNITGVGEFHLLSACMDYAKLY